MTLTTVSTTVLYCDVLKTSLESKLFYLFSMLNYSTDIPVIRHGSKQAAKTFNRNTNRNEKNNHFSNQND